MYDCIIWNPSIKYYLEGGLLFSLFLLWVVPTCCFGCLKNGALDRTDSMSWVLIGPTGRFKGGIGTFTALGRGVVLITVEVETIDMDGVVDVVDFEVVGWYASDGLEIRIFVS